MKRGKGHAVGDPGGSPHPTANGCWIVMVAVVTVIVCLVVWFWPY